jgi:hypothetical protein
MQQYPAIGKSYPIGDVQALSAILQYYAENKMALQDAKKASIALATSELNWEIESKKLIEIIQNTL